GERPARWGCEAIGERPAWWTWVSRERPARAKVESATQVCGAVSKWRLTLVSDFLREVAVRMYKDGVALVSLSERGNPLWSSKDEEYLRMRGAPLVTMWRMKGRRAPVLIPDSAFLRYRGFHQIREQVLWVYARRP
ncbi:hypothetical protein CYMTET_35527, partial [Cymbomonas tetramitiformis]